MTVTRLNDILTAMRGPMREHYIDIDGMQLWTGCSGAGGSISGSPVLLCSGGPGCCDYMGPVAGMIDDLVEVWRLEARGCGRSQAAPRYDVATMLAEIDVLQRYLGCESWIVGGHSWGANLALAYALAHPSRVRGVLYLAGNGFQNDRAWYAAYKEAQRQHGEPRPNFAYPVNKEVNRQVNQDWVRFLHSPDLWRRVAALPVPVLVVAAGRDIRPRWPVEQLAQLLPKSRFEIIEHATHYLWLSHPDRLRQLLRAFLADLADLADRADCGHTEARE